MPQELAHRLAAILQLPPNKDMVAPLRKRLVTAYGEAPSLELLTSYLLDGRQMPWLVVFQIGALIRKYPDWLISLLAYDTSRHTQVVILLDAMAREVPSEFAADPRKWLTVALSRRGIEVNEVTMRRWLFGRSAIQDRYRADVCDILKIDPSFLPAMRRRRHPGLGVHQAGSAQPNHNEVWLDGDALSGTGRLRPLEDLAGPAANPGFIFSLLSMMDRQPGIIPSGEELERALSDSAQMNWPVALKIVQILDRIEPALLPAKAAPGDRHARLILAIARHGRPSSDQELTQWLLEEMASAQGVTSRQSLSSWLSGSANPQRGSVTRIEAVLGLADGEVWNGAPADARQRSVDIVPAGYIAAERALSAIGFGPLGVRVAMCLPIEGPVSLVSVSEALADHVSNEAELTIPDELAYGWLSGDVTPSPLEREIIGASLSLPQWWIETGRRTPTRKARTVELRSAVGKLRSQMATWRSIIQMQAEFGREPDFEARLRLALSVRGAIEKRDASDQELISGARYLMHMRFDLRRNRKGGLIMPPEDDIAQLALRCGVEVKWLATGAASEHSFLRYRLGGRAVG